MLIPLLFSVAFAGVPTKTKAPEEEGEARYRAHCAACHGAQGLGDGPALVALRSEAPALAGRVEALPDAPEIELILEGRGDMPGYASVMGRNAARDILLWLSRLDPETGEPVRPRPPKLQAPVERGEPVPAAAGRQPAAPPADEARPAETPPVEAPPPVDVPI